MNLLLIHIDFPTMLNGDFAWMLPLNRGDSVATLNERGERKIVPIIVEIRQRYVLATLLSPPTR